jgi:hypothetical protein
VLGSCSEKLSCIYRPQNTQKMYLDRTCDYSVVLVKRVSCVFGKQFVYFPLIRQ